MVQGKKFNLSMEINGYLLSFNDSESIINYSVSNELT